jgi:hypothetical protein
MFKIPSLVDLMPFTPAHMIAAAPVWFGTNRRLHLPGLLVGSMIPDIEYFVSLRPTGTLGHTLPGIFLQGLPSSIGLLLLMRYVLWQPFLRLIPNSWVVKMPLLRSMSWRNPVYLFNVCGSIVVGAISHIVWDSFSHAGGWAVLRWPVLQSQLGLLPVYKIVQYGSGILGLLGLAMWLILWFRQLPTPVASDRSPKQHRIWQQALVWMMILLIAFITSVIAVMINSHAGDRIQSIVVRAVVGGIAGFWFGFGMYAIGFWLRALRL